MIDLNGYKFKDILVNINGAHATVYLNRPEKRNALNANIVAELNDVLADLDKEDSVKIISLKGKGKAFCSGADLGHLKKMRQFDRAENLADSLSLAELYQSIYLFPKPVIAIVEGPALAGGCGLATACDFVYATTEAKFGYPEVRIGFVAALVSAFLARQIGQRKAKELLLTGSIISADKAFELGLISRVFPKNAIRKAEEDLVHSLKQNSSPAMLATKNLFKFHLTEELQTLAEVNAKFRESSDFIEGISSFIEKRKPKWVLQS